jgi:5'-methylthioadenosine phosphorylase
VLGDACDAAGVKAHREGTYVCIEGPQFSTLAEAHVHRQLRFDVIGMTNVTEAKLAREAELCYATVAMITDYDCWHPEHSSVTVADILSNLSCNADNAQNVIRRAVRTMPRERACRCGRSLEHAIITDRTKVPAAAKRRLTAIAGKYLS